MYLLRLFVLLGFLTALFLGIGYYFAGTYGMIIGVSIALLTNFIAYWYSDSFVLKLYKARPAGEDYPELDSCLEKIAGKAGIPKPRLYLVNTDVPNAFATGRSPSRSAVAVTKGLMHLSIEEIEGVLAHEIAHIKHRDTLVATLAATISGALTWFAYLFLFGDARNRNIFSLLLLFVLAPLAAALIRMAISRNNEFSADKTGASLSDPLHLASALEKIAAVAKQHPIRGNESTAHMFIVNPFSGSFMKLFSTHPPVEERVARLRRMAV
jgi:heat shock protein HtpX